MFSSGGRRSSLRPKTPGRPSVTPGPSRFSLGLREDNVTPSGTSWRFTDADRPPLASGSVPDEERQQGREAAETLTVQRMGLGDGAQGTLFAKRTRTVSSGDGPSSNGDPLQSDRKRVFSSQSSDAAEKAKKSSQDASEGLATKFGSPEVHARDEERPLQVWTGVSESAGAYRGRQRESIVERTLGQTGEEEVWRRFRGAGSLDEDTLVRREKEELQRRLEGVERELADYRYNLGVLILEHKNCGPQIEELEEGLRRTQEELGKESRSLKLALDDVTRREDGLRASLRAERAVIADLRRSLEDMHSKLQSEEKSSRERLSKAEELERRAENDHERAGKLFKKASEDLKAAQQLEEGLKFREGELDGKLRGLSEREKDVGSREAEVKRGQDEVKEAQRQVTEKEFELAGRRKATEEEFEEERRRIEARGKGEELRVEALRRSVEGERERMHKQMEEEREAAERELSARKDEVSAQESRLATKEKALQALEKELEGKREEVSKRDESLDQREKLLGDQKREMLRTEADLIEQEKSLEDLSTRLADQEREWQRIEAKLDLGTQELDAREAGLRTREAAAESLQKELEAREVALREREEDVDTRLGGVQKKEEELAELLRRVEEKSQAVEREAAELQKTKAEEVQAREQADKRAKELETTEAQLQERETALEEQTRQIATREQELAIREEHLSVRETATEAELRLKAEEVDAERRDAEAEIAEQQRQLQAERARENARAQASRAEVAEARAALKKELQETRGALEEDFQARLLAANAANERAADMEVERRVSELSRNAETWAEERSAVRLQERLAELEKDVEMRVTVQVKERVSEMEVMVEQEVERRVSEGVKKGVEKEVKARVKDAVKKAVAEAKAKYDQEKGAAVEKAVREAEMKAEQEKTAAVEQAVRLEQVRVTGERAWADGEAQVLQNGEGLEGVKIQTVGEQAGVSKEGVPRRSWFGLVSPSRVVKARKNVQEESELGQDLPVGAAPEPVDGFLSPAGIESLVVDDNPVGLSGAAKAGAEGNVNSEEGAVNTEPESAGAADANEGPLPKRPKLQCKRKQPEPSLDNSPETRPLKQRKGVTDSTPDTPFPEPKQRGPVEALGAAVTAVGMAADAITGPFGFVLDDTDLGFVPGSTVAKARREEGVKKPRWSLWPGFLSPQKAKPEEGGQDRAETGPPAEERAEEDGQTEEQRSLLRDEEVPEAGELGADVGLVSMDEDSVLNGDGTPPEIDLRGADVVEASVSEVPATLVAKTPNTTAGRPSAQTPKPLRSSKQTPAGVRASSRLRDRASSAEPRGILEPIPGSQPAGPAENLGRSSPGENGGLPQASGNGSGSGASLTKAPKGRVLQRALTAEEQAKMDRILARLEAEERAIEADARAIAATEAASEDLVHPNASPEIVPQLESPGPESLNVLSPSEEVGASKARSGGVRKEQLAGRKEIGGKGSEEKRSRDSRRAGKGGLGGRTSPVAAPDKTDDVLLTEAAIAKDQELPEDGFEEDGSPLPEAPGGTPGAVGCAIPTPPSDPQSPPGPTTTLPPKTPKSAFGRAINSIRTVWGFRGESSGVPASEEGQEGSLEGRSPGLGYRSQAGELRSIVDNLVEAADRDEETDEGGPERLEFGTPEGSQISLNEVPERGPRLDGEGILPAIKGKSEEILTEAQQVGGAFAATAKTVMFDLNERAPEWADAAVGVPAADVAADVVALGGSLSAAEATAGEALGGVAEALTGNIGEALADEMGAVHTQEAGGKSSVGMGLEAVTGALASAGAATKSAVVARNSKGSAEQGAPATKGVPPRGAKLHEKVEGGKGEERRGSKRKAAERSGKGTVTESETEDEGAPKRGRVKRRVKQEVVEEEAGLVDPRVVDFANKFGGESEGEIEQTGGGRRRTSKVVVDPRDGEDVSAGLRRYNLRKSTLVKMHVWEPRGADFGAVNDSEGIHTRGGASSTPRNLQRSVFGGDNPFLEDMAPGNPHSLEEMRTPRNARVGAGRRSDAAGGHDEEADQANAGWRWLGFLGW